MARVSAPRKAMEAWPGTSAHEWVEVATVSDLPPNGVKSLEIAGRRLALVNVAGRVSAFDARCPHRGGPLDKGTIYLGALVCPWHNFRYDLRTGANLFPANVYPDDLPQLREQLKPANVYDVRVEDGRVFVCLPAKQT